MCWETEDYLSTCLYVYAHVFFEKIMTSDVL